VGGFVGRSPRGALNATGSVPTGSWRSSCGRRPIRLQPETVARLEDELGWERGRVAPPIIQVEYGSRRAAKLAAKPVRGINVQVPPCDFPGFRGDFSVLENSGGKSAGMFLTPRYGYWAACGPREFAQQGAIKYGYWAACGPREFAQQGAIARHRESKHPPWTWNSGVPGVPASAPRMNPRSTGRMLMHSRPRCLPGSSSHTSSASRSFRPKSKLAEEFPVKTRVSGPPGAVKGITRPRALRGAWTGPGLEAEHAHHSAPLRSEMVQNPNPSLPLACPVPPGADIWQRERLGWSSSHMLLSEGAPCAIAMT
jgi:hypothetical protein